MEMMDSPKEMMDFSTDMMDFQMQMLSFPASGASLHQPYPMPLPQQGLIPDLIGGIVPTHSQPNYLLLEHEVAANAMEPSHTTGPASRKRAKKISITRPEDWIPYQARIRELYVEKKWKLEDVQKKISEETGFYARYVPYPPRGPKYAVTFAIV